MKKRVLFVILTSLLVLSMGATASAGLATSHDYGVQIRNQIYSSTGGIMKGGDYVKDVNSNAYFDNFISGIPYETKVFVGNTAACATMSGWTGATRTASIYDAYRGAGDVYTYKPWFKNTANPGELCYIEGYYYYYAQ